MFYKPQTAELSELQETLVIVLAFREKLNSLQARHCNPHFINLANDTQNPLILFAEGLRDHIAWLSGRSLCRDACFAERHHRSTGGGSPDDRTDWPDTLLEELLVAEEQTPRPVSYDYRHLVCHYESSLTVDQFSDVANQMRTPSAYQAARLVVKHFDALKSGKIAARIESLEKSIMSDESQPL